MSYIPTTTLLAIIHAYNGQTDMCSLNSHEPNVSLIPKALLIERADMFSKLEKNKNIIVSLTIILLKVH